MVEPLSISISSSSSSCIQTQFAKVSSGFTSLSNSPSELWKAYLLKFLDSYAYFSFSLVFTLFLSDDFGMTDIQAGTIYGAWGALITVFGLFTGTVIDNLGVAKCLRIGFVLSFLTRVVIFATNSRNVLLTCLLITLPFSNCLGIPVLTVGIRRYTNDENRGFAFGLFYVVMNVGALVAGPLVDALTLYYNDKHHGKAVGDDVGESTSFIDDDESDIDTHASNGLTTVSWVMTTNRAIILSGVVANFIAVFVAFTVREIKVDATSASSSVFEDSKNSPTAVGSGNSDVNNKSSKISKFQPMKGSSCRILAETMRTPNFRRFLLVCLLTINVRMVFRHL
jgi:MFS family permease